MCGRFTFFDPHAVVQVFNLEEFRIHLTARYNIAPSQDVPIITINQAGNRELSLCHWGLVPSWSKEPKTTYSMINARIETLFEKPTFKKLINQHRCIVPTNGYYEWQQTDGLKKPMFISMPQHALFGLAGLWDEWHDQETGEVLTTFTIITQPSSHIVQYIHPRMPAIVTPDNARDWLSEAPFTQTYLNNFLNDAPYEKLEAYEVSTLVNNPRNDSSSCIQRL